MTRIAVIGGTGYAGRHIVAEAVERGHDVLSIARKAPAERVEGAVYVEASLLDPETLIGQLQEVEVVVFTASPRGDMAGAYRTALAATVAALPAQVRVGVVGGAGGSLVAPGGPRLVDTDAFPEAFRAEALELAGVLEDLQAVDAERDWFLIHPAGGFGPFNPGERTGAYRTGGDVLVKDAEGQSFISGPDLAIAVLDEIEQSAHSRQRFTVGY